MKGNGAGWSYNAAGRWVVGVRVIMKQIERWKIEGCISRSNQATKYTDRLARNTGRAAHWDDYAFRELQNAKFVPF
jgi:hypothetical protein